MSVIPSRLHRVKVFESRMISQVEANVPDGATTAGEKSTATIEEQINAWINSSRNFIVGTGPLSMQYFRTGIWMVEHRMLPVIYAPAVEDPNVKTYGEAEVKKERVAVGPDVQQPEPGSQGGNWAAGDVGTSSVGGGDGVSKLPPCSLPARPAKPTQTDDSGRSVFPRPNTGLSTRRAGLLGGRAGGGGEPDKEKLP